MPTLGEFWRKLAVDLFDLADFNGIRQNRDGIYQKSATAKITNKIEICRRRFPVNSAKFHRVLQN